MLMFLEVTDRFLFVITEVAVSLVQMVGCLARHRVEHRLAWLLLEAHDRSGGAAVLPLTQEFLADMLAVQRTTITPIAMKLQAAGAIRYGRGAVEVVDRTKLEAMTCECYATTQAYRRRIEDHQQAISA